MVIVCPNCGAYVSFSETPRCEACGWKAKIVGDVVSLFTSDDRQDGVNREYARIYNKISSDDLDHQIVDNNYHALEALRFAAYTGDISGLDVADIGSGRGIVLNALSKGNAKTLIGVDISMQYLKVVSRIKGVRAIQANAEKLPFREAFDVIVSSDVMEHVLNLGSFLVSINWALRPGGRFIVRVPYRENMLQYAKQLGAKYPFVHLRTYNKKLLVDDLERSGFEIEKIHFDGQYLTRLRHIWTKKRWKSFYEWVNNKFSIEENFDRPQSHIIELYKKIFLDPVTIVAICRKKSEVKHMFK